MATSDSNLRGLLRQPPWRRRSRTLAIVVLTALAAIGLYHTWVRLSNSSGDVVAVVRERRVLQPDEEQASAIDRIASEILSPATIRNALLASARDESQRSAAPLAELVERWRKELRVDIEPGKDKQPWSIFILVSQSPSPQAAQVVNAVAEQYCSSRRAAVAAEQRQSLRQTQTQAAKARKTAAGVREELEKQIDALMHAADAWAAARLAAADDDARNKRSEAKLAELAQRRKELAASIAELKARKTALLERLTPVHPDVRSIDGEIAVARRRLEQLPPEDPAPDDEQLALPELPSTVDAQPSAAVEELKQTLEEIRKLRQALAKAESSLELANLAEERAWQRIVEGDLSQVASIKAARAKTPRSPAVEWPLAVLSGAVGALVAWLLAARSGRESEAFHDVDELEETLGLPVVGVLSADEHSMTQATERRSASGEMRRVAG